MEKYSEPEKQGIVTGDMLDALAFSFWGQEFCETPVSRLPFEVPAEEVHNISDCRIRQLEGYDPHQRCTVSVTQYACEIRNEGRWSPVSLVEVLWTNGRAVIIDLDDESTQVREPKSDEFVHAQNGSALADEARLASKQAFLALSSLDNF